MLLQGHQVVPARCLHDVKRGLAELGQLLRAVLHLLGMLLRELRKAVDLQKQVKKARVTVKENNSGELDLAALSAVIPCHSQKAAARKYSALRTQAALLTLPGCMLCSRMVLSSWQSAWNRCRGSWKTGLSRNSCLFRAALAAASLVLSMADFQHLKAFHSLCCRNRRSCLRATNSFTSCSHCSRPARGQTSNTVCTHFAGQHQSTGLAHAVAAQAHTGAR